MSESRDTAMDVNETPDYQERLKQFATQVKRHDLTWDYADDTRARQRGREELRAIQKLARGLENEDVMRIWNANVDRNLVEAGRQSYYWRDPRQWGQASPEADKFAQRVWARLNTIYQRQEAQHERSQDQGRGY